ncbi:insertion element iso-IS1N insA domain protein [Escherichia coli 2845650]|nr:insertion element iso-IS1N insA domain protein [Escherichia coli 2845650]EZK26671.1 insertion element iso-IS1N insA domain protein [Escherichia coli 2-011-08_S1_C2]
MPRFVGKPNRLKSMVREKLNISAIGAKCAAGLSSLITRAGRDQGKIIRSSLFVLNNLHFIFKN